MAPKFDPNEVKLKKKFPKKIFLGSGEVRDSAPRSSDGMAPPSNASPSEAAS